MNILVVEDDAQMARLLVQGLEEEAHQVDLARDGCTALALSKAGSFDLVLLDVMLPGVDGIEVAKQIRCRKADVAGAHAYEREMRCPTSLRALTLARTTI